MRFILSQSARTVSDSAPKQLEPAPPDERNAPEQDLAAHLAAHRSPDRHRDRRSHVAQRQVGFPNRRMGLRRNLPGRGRERRQLTLDVGEPDRAAGAKRGPRAPVKPEGGAIDRATLGTETAAHTEPHAVEHVARAPDLDAPLHSLDDIPEHVNEMPWKREVQPADEQLVSPVIHIDQPRASLRRGEMVNRVGVTETNHISRVHHLQTHIPFLTHPLNLREYSRRPRAARRDGRRWRSRGRPGRATCPARRVPAAAPRD